MKNLDKIEKQIILDFQLGKITEEEVFEKIYKHKERKRCIKITKDIMKNINKAAIRIGMLPPKEK